MKKVMKLVRVQIWAILGSIFAIGEYRKKKTRALYVGFVFFITIMSIVSFIYAYSIGVSLKLFNSIKLLPAMFMALTSVIVLFTTIFKIKGTIFGFKDYDMVMSLPVSHSNIVASRLILLYSINSVFVFIIMIPMMIAYGIHAQPGVQFYIYSLLTLLFIPLIPIIIASFLGTILTYISMRFRYSNIIYMVFVFLVLLGIIIVPFFIESSEEALVEMGQEITNQVEAIYPLAGIYSKAVIEESIGAVLVFIAISILAFLVFSLVVGKVFKRINTVIMTGRYRVNYKLGELKISSPLKALYLKDLKRYFASPIYLMNTGIGVVLVVFAAIALPFVDLKSITGEMDITGAVKDFIPLFISFCIATSCTTMASISIEGKKLWIIKSIPVSTYLIFASKIMVNLTVLAPVLFASIIIGITMQMPFINGLLMVLVAASFSVFVSLYGLVINLNFPNMTWTHEASIIKQSTASMISVFSGIGIIVIQLVLLTIVGNAILGMLIFMVLLWVLNFLLYKRLMNKGRRQFENL